MSSLFEGERIRLTPITDDELPQFAEWLSDFGLQRLVNPGMSFPHNVDDLLNPEGWFQADLKNEKSRIFAVRTIADDVFIGTCAIVNLNMFAHHAEIGINLAHPDYRSKGYGGEIMLLTMRLGFEQFNLNRITLKVMGFNTRAIRLYEKLGFEHEVREREVFFHDGAYFDQLHMSILRTEWEATHG
jgi:RimJ/RimL family protein N-acetyltransferase